MIGVTSLVVLFLFLTALLLASTTAICLHTDSDSVHTTAAAVGVTFSLDKMVLFSAVSQ